MLCFSMNPFAVPCKMSLGLGGFLPTWAICIETEVTLCHWPVSTSNSCVGSAPINVLFDQGKIVKVRVRDIA